MRGRLLPINVVQRGLKYCTAQRTQDLAKDATLELNGREQVGVRARLVEADPDRIEEDEDADRDEHDRGRDAHDDRPERPREVDAHTGMVAA